MANLQCFWARAITCGESSTGIVVTVASSTGLVASGTLCACACGYEGDGTAGGAEGGAGSRVVRPLGEE